MREKLAEDLGDVLGGDVGFVVLSVDQHAAVARDQRHGFLHGQQVVVEHGAVVHELLLLGHEHGLRALLLEPVVEERLVLARVLARVVILQRAQQARLARRLAEDRERVVEPGPELGEHDGVVTLEEDVPGGLAAVDELVANLVAHGRAQAVQDAVDGDVVGHVHGPVVDERAEAGVALAADDVLVLAALHVVDERAVHDDRRVHGPLEHGHVVAVQDGQRVHAAAA
nr:MAG: hypothetical protein [Molluscum contagiosum virus]